MTDFKPPVGKRADFVHRDAVADVNGCELNCCRAGVPPAESVVLSIAACNKPRAIPVWVTPCTGWKPALHSWHRYADLIGGGQK